MCVGGWVCVRMYVCVHHVKLQKFKTEEQPLELCGCWGILSSKKFQELCFQNRFVRCVRYAGVVKPCQTGQLGDPDLANKPQVASPCCFGQQGLLNTSQLYSTVSAKRAQVEY